MGRGHSHERQPLPLVRAQERALSERLGEALTHIAALLMVADESDHYSYEEDRVKAAMEFWERERGERLDAFEGHQTARIERR